MLLEGRQKLVPISNNLQRVCTYYELHLPPPFVMNYCVFLFFQFSFCRMFLDFSSISPWSRSTT